MGRAKRICFSNKYLCKCNRAADGDKRLSKRKQEFLKKIRTGVQERVRIKHQKTIKEGNTVKKKPGPHQPVKHYVNLPGWVVRNLIDICKKQPQTRNKSRHKGPHRQTHPARQTHQARQNHLPRQTHSMESVREKPRKKMENEQNNGRFSPKGNMYLNLGNPSRFGF